MEENIINRETEDLNEILRVRREKLDALKAAGKNPYEKVRYPRTHLSVEVLEGFDALEGKTVSLAGRMTIRRTWSMSSRKEGTFYTMGLKIFL